MQMTRVEACIKTKYDSLRKFRVFEISPSITLLQGLTKHQNRLRRYGPIFFLLFVSLHTCHCVVFEMMLCPMNLVTAIRRKFKGPYV